MHLCLLAYSHIGDSFLDKGTKQGKVSRLGNFAKETLSFTGKYGI
jgi:hypothetical protein